VEKGKVAGVIDMAAQRKPPVNSRRMLAEATGFIFLSLDMPIIQGARILLGQKTQVFRVFI
jgi:hypothetical protein